MKEQMFCEMIYYEANSFKIVHVRYRRKFIFNTSSNRIQIFKLVSNLEAHDTCKDPWATGFSPSEPLITKAKHPRML